MARERLIEQSIVNSSIYIKQIPLTEANNKLLCEGVEYNASLAYEFPIWRLNTVNLNNRIYTKELALKVIKENKTTLGLADHPSENSEQPEGSVKNICFVEKNPHIKVINGQEILFADIYLVGDHGKKTIKDIIDVGGGIGLSSSAFGEVNRDRTVDINSFELERYADHVLNPSGSVFGFAENKIGESVQINEQISLDKIYVGSEIKYDNTNWKIEKIDGPDKIEIRKANNDSIYKIISIKDVQEVMNEGKITEIENNAVIQIYKNIMDREPYIDHEQAIKITASTSGKSIDEVRKLLGESINSKNLKEDKLEKGDLVVRPNGKIYYVLSIEDGIAELVFGAENIKIPLENLKKVDKQKEGTMATNKKYSIEEKNIRLSIKNLMKEAENKSDIEEKLSAYGEILEWFEDGNSFSDLKEEVDNKLSELNAKVKELAKKGQKTDSLLENEKDLNKAVMELTEYNKQIQEKFEVAAEMLDNMKVFNKKMEELYEHQKAKANGMTSTKLYVEALDFIEKQKKAINEAKVIISDLKKDKNQLTEELSKTKKSLTEKINFENLRKKQLEVKEQFLKEKEDEAKKDQEEKKAEIEKEDMKEKENRSIRFSNDKEDIQELYESLIRYNENYSEFKEDILSKKTLFEAQVFVMKIKETVEKGSIRREKNELEENISRRSSTYEPETKSITSLKKKGWK